MKKAAIFTVLAIALMAMTAGAQDYQYYGSVTLSATDVGLGGVVLLPNGDLYYCTFADPNSELFYVSNAVPGVLTSADAVSLVSTEPMQSGRGLNDLEVDSAGNVFLSGTGSGAADSVLKKFGPAPTHTLLWDFQSTTAIRHNGIELLDDDTLAVGEAFSSLAIYSATDGTDTLVDITGGANYSRAIAYNPGNDDMYVTKNGGNSDVALQIVSGGSLSNFAGYSYVGTDLAGYAVDTAFGGATQPVDFDANNNQLIAADKLAAATEPQAVGILNVSGSGASSVFTEVQSLTANPIASASYASVAGVAYERISGNDYIAVATQYDDLVTFAIDIWERVPLSVEGWDRY